MVWVTVEKAIAGRKIKGKWDEWCEREGSYLIHTSLESEWSRTKSLALQRALRVIFIVAIRRKIKLKGDIIGNSCKAKNQWLGQILSVNACYENECQCIVQESICLETSCTQDNVAIFFFFKFKRLQRLILTPYPIYQILQVFIIWRRFKFDSHKWWKRNIFMMSQILIPTLRLK